MAHQSAIELLAPGGSLNQAVHALRAGATAVYAGAQRFSARSHAGNLDMNQFARLAGEAQSRGAQVYAALNTLLTNQELPLALDLSWELWAAGAQAIIVQDIGLLHALRRHGPALALHASTQLAIHSSSGARQLQDWGVRRVVLARELTVDEIATIHAAVPEMELEVFIHGALCYSVSGLCLASGLILGRSGNRGDCGQICRTWSQLGSTPASGIINAGSWFSMNDLEANQRIHDLTQAGVSSLKIEGRMKAPEWTVEVVAHYRALLDRQDPADHLRHSRELFGRLPSPAWLGDPRGCNLINHSYAGSVGVVAGRVKEVRSGRALVQLECDLAVSDGVMLLRPGSPPFAWKAGVRNLSADHGTTSWTGHAGQCLWIQAEADGQAFRSTDRGLELRKIADHAANLSVIKAESLPLYRRALDLFSHLEATTAGSELVLRSPGLDDQEFRYSVQVEVARGAGSLVENLTAQLQTGADSGFCAGKVQVNDSLDGKFLPPRVLKELRRNWQTDLIEIFKSLRQRRLQDLQRYLSEQSAEESILQWVLPLRSTLNPKGDLPFIDQFDDLAISDLAVWNACLVLPLAPVFFNDQQAFQSLQSWLHRLAEHAPESRLILGLGNLAQLYWFRQLRNDPIVGKLLTAAFADYGLYAANTMSAAILCESPVNLLGVLPWIEAKDLVQDPGFHPPLFISRACFHRESLGRGCPANCPKHWKYSLEQGKRRFKVLVRNCISYVF